MRLGTVVLGLVGSVVIAPVGGVKGSVVDVSSVASVVDVSRSLVVNVCSPNEDEDDGVAVVDEDLSAALLDVMSAAYVDDDVVVEVACSTAVASLDVVVAGGPSLAVVLGLVGSVVDASVGGVEGSVVDVASVEPATDVLLAIVDDWPAVDVAPAVVAASVCAVVDEGLSSAVLDVSSAAVDDDVLSSVVEVASSTVDFSTGTAEVVA